VRVGSLFGFVFAGSIHPNSNRGTENNNQNNFDANGNLLHLDNIANLEWYYNNTLNKLTKADKT
jgi:insecticidal toxin complex protein TccC